MKKIIYYSIVFVLFALILISACQRSASTPTILIESMERVIDKRDRSHGVCSDFHLGEKEVIDYYKMAIKVSTEAFNEKAIVLPCRYKGKLSMNGEVLSWEIVAGGAGYLYKGQEINERYLCITDECCKSIDGLCQ